MDTIQSICVLGAGTMGHGVAHVAAMAGYQTTLFDVSDDALAKGMASIKANLDKGVEKGKVSAADRDGALERLQSSSSLSQAAASANLVIEAVPEKLDLKRSLFSELDGICSESTIFASNTSSLSIAKISEGLKRPQAFLGMHFFNPVHIMALLEIVVHEGTSDDVLASAKAVGERMGKTSIVVKDFPGFATSRLGVVLGLEAIRMVEQGVASAQDIDTAMELGYRHPMGPLKLSDLVGLDVRLGIAEYLHRELASEAFRPPQLMRDMVAAGKLGKKSGQGFYSW